MNVFRAKVAKLDINGVVLDISPAEIKQDGLGSKRKSLEQDVWTYRFSDLSVTLMNFDREYFRDYNSQSLACFLWIEKSSDGVTWATDFFGYIHPKAVKTPLPTGHTSLTALSIEKLFDSSPAIIARGSYRAIVNGFVLGVPATNSSNGNHGYIKDVTFPSFEPGESYDFYLDWTTPDINLAMPNTTETYRYRRAGSLFRVSATRRDSDESMELLALLKQTPPPNCVSGNPLCNFFVDLDFYRFGNTVYPVGHTEGYQHEYTSRLRRVDREVVGDSSVPKYFYIEDSVIARNIEGRYDMKGLYSGWVDALVMRDELDPFQNHEVWRFPIEKAEFGSYEDNDGEAFEGVKITIAFGSRKYSSTINDLDFEQSKINLIIAPPAIDPGGAQCILFSNQMYGIGGDHTDPFPGPALLQALCMKIPFFNRLNPNVVWHGVPGTIDRRVVLSQEPATALLEMQKLMDVLITFDFGEVQANGLPRAVVNVYTRDYIVSQGKTTIKTPMDWEEEPAGFLPVVVVQGPAPVNMYDSGSQSVGWYSEDANGNPNFTDYATEIPSGVAHVNLSLDKVILNTFSFHSGKIKEYYYNDFTLRRIAKRVYDFYGRFYRSAQARVVDTNMELPDLVERVIREPFQEKDAIVMEQETSYLTREVTLTLLMDTSDTI